MKEAVAKLKERIEKKMEQISPLMLKIHQNLSVGAVWQKLDDLY
jgi:DNA polymerase I-like protein with 3'-5' exonuclease and polymerase domains